MSKLRSLALFAGLALTGTLFACADTSRVVVPQQEVGAPSLELIAPAAVVPALTRTVPLAGTIVVTATIGAEGGTISVPEAGFRMTVPKGTVRRNTTFTVKALAGSMVAYEFFPEGKWQTKIEMEQDLRVTSWSTLPTAPLLKAGYFRSTSDLNFSTNEATVSELLPVQLDTILRWVRWRVDHFSGYMVAMG